MRRSLGEIAGKVEHVASAVERALLIGEQSVSTQSMRAASSAARSAAIASAAHPPSATRMVHTAAHGHSISVLDRCPWSSSAPPRSEQDLLALAPRVGRRRAAPRPQEAVWVQGELKVPLIRPRYQIVGTQPVEGHKSTIRRDVCCKCAWFRAPRSGSAPLPGRIVTLSRSCRVAGVVLVVLAAKRGRCRHIYVWPRSKWPPARGRREVETFGRPDI